MVDASDEDMTKPVTRGELKQELAEFEQRLDAKLDAKLDARFDEFEKRMDAKLDAKLDVKLELLLGAIMARVDQQLATRFIQFRAEVDRDFARHTSAMIESFRPQVAAVDDKYRDLPPRVARLEAAVFGPTPRARPVRAAPKKRRRKAS